MAFKLVQDSERRAAAAAGGARQKAKEQGISISMVGEALQWQVSVGIDEGRGRS